MNNKLIETALNCGAFKATILPAAEIKTGREFRDICKSNQCGNYGRCWTCPPDCGDIDVLMAKLKEYDSVLLYQTVGELEDSFDIEGMEDAHKKHLKVTMAIGDEVKTLLDVPYLQLSAGACGICEVCAKRTGEPCRFPDKALTSLEACGINVYETVKNTGLKYINGQNTVTYFGAVFF